MGLDLKLNFIRIKINIASTRDAFDERKTLKLSDSSNNKESFLGTIIDARTTGPALILVLSGRFHLGEDN